MSFKILNLHKQVASDVLTPSNGNNALFIDTDNNLTMKNEDGESQALADLEHAFGVYTASIVTQGDTSTPSTIKIQCKDLAGNALASTSDSLRVQVCDDGLYGDATNATIAVTDGSALRYSISSTKDIVISPSNTAYAALSTNLSGSNNDLVWTAVTAGRSGNDITVAYVNPGTPSASLSVSVSNTAITVNLATDAGTAQVETAVVTAAAGATENGVLTVVFTSAAVTGSPVSVPVTLTTAEDDASKVATAIRAALTANAAIAAAFTIGGTSANVVATRTVAAANDATLNIAWGAYVAGISAVASSSNTTAGVAPAITSTGDLIKAAVLASAAASALVTVADKSGNDGSGAVTAMAATSLSGGGTGLGSDYFIALTNASAETVTLRLGPPTIGGYRAGDYTHTLDVTHAAP